MVVFSSMLHPIKCSIKISLSLMLGSLIGQLYSLKTSFLISLFFVTLEAMPTLIINGILSCPKTVHIFFS